jgi:hypothetical protein
MTFANRFRGEKESLAHFSMIKQKKGYEKEEPKPKFDFILVFILFFHLKATQDAQSSALKMACSPNHNPVSVQSRHPQSNSLIFSFQTNDRVNRGP